MAGAMMTGAMAGAGAVVVVFLLELFFQASGRPQAVHFFALSGNALSVLPQ